MSAVETHSSLNCVHQTMWTAIRMAVFACVAGVYLSGPAWEQHDSHHHKWDLIMAAFWAAIAITYATKLYRQLKTRFA